ncbi:hypothetical protein [Glaciecola sp. SC05]|uniref:hypothetical protein n=1 Tax=Glaciecola sp. SC05 TaxID=1987355 RepID=UPI003528F454
MGLKLKITALSLGLLLVGCGSTSKNLSKVDGEFIYPSMPILEESVFVWNENESEALNVVKMAQPAGIGNSLRDYQDGTQASIGQIGGLSGLVDAGFGFWSSGLFTVVQGESLRAGVNNAVEFNPAIVDVVNKNDVSINGAPSYKLVRNYIAQKVKAAIAIEHPDVTWGGVYSVHSGVEKNDLFLVFNDEASCRKNRSLMRGEVDTKPIAVRKLSDVFIDGPNENGTYCGFSFDLSITYTTESDDIVIVAESLYAPYFVEALVNHYDGYVVVPDYYKFSSKSVMRTKYAYVSKSGEKLLFENPSK